MIMSSLYGLATARLHRVGLCLCHVMQLRGSNGNQLLFLRIRFHFN